MPARPRRLGKWAAALAVLVVGAAATAQAQAPTPDQQRLREIYKELVEINTTASAGNCTQAARGHGRAAQGRGASDRRHANPRPAGSAEGRQLIAPLHGTDAQARPLLLLAHIDVVEAKREDWVRDPFKLVEENGCFYARGASDDKAMAAVFTDAWCASREGFKPRPRHQARADLRRGDAGRVQRRRVAAATNNRD